MLLLRNKRLVIVDTSEDSLEDNEILAIKKPNPKARVKEVKDTIYKLMPLVNTNSIRCEYNFYMIQSPYEDNSGIGEGYNPQETKGACIQHMLHDDFIITINGVNMYSYD